MKLPLRSTLLLLVCLALPALAQEDRPAGLFTRARQLPLVSQSVRVTAADGVASIEVVQVFHNDGPDEAQADFQFRLPSGATVAGFGFWDGDTLRRAELKEREAAREAHQAAADAHRTTALLEVDGAVQKFSVYPLRAGELKRVVTTLRVPVARELGRSQVRLPLDAFLGQAPVVSTVSVQLESEDPLAELGVDGAAMKLVSRSERRAQLVFQAQSLADVWWVERGEPLVLSADAVRLDDGKFALQVRAALNDAGPWKASFKQVHVLVDGSFSMKRRSAAVQALVARLVAQSAAPVSVHVVAGRTLRFDKGDVALAAVDAVMKGTAGFSTSLKDVAGLMHTLECHAAGVRCILVTDPELTKDSADEDLRQLDLPAVVLADAFERTWAQGRLPKDSRVVDPDVDAPARLASLADQLVLPVLDVQMLDAKGLQLSERQERRVAEGGLLRLSALMDQVVTVTVRGELAGHAFERSLEPVVHAPDSSTGQAVRRAYFERRLADQLLEYATSRDPALKQAIIELSLREKIPTSLTSMHVASPELSMVDIKPGDPLLVVPLEPGLVEATAWYPFGDWRRLVKDGANARLVDRFLVPRGWAERWYAVEVFKRYEDGTVRQQQAWYRVDETSPGLAVTSEGGVLVVRSADDSKDLSSVLAHLSDGRVVTLSAMGEIFSVRLDALTRSFALVLRDRAGNRTTQHFEVVDGAARPVSADQREDRSTARGALQVDGVGSGLSVARGVATLSTEGKRLSFPAPHLRSLEVTASLTEGDMHFVGTSGGDFFVVRCGATCEVVFSGGSPGGHPISGMARAPGVHADALLVGILGEGVQRYDGRSLKPSGLSFGSVFVTALAVSGKDVLVGTAYNGLWRVVADGRVLKSRFPGTHVGALTGTELLSGAGRFRLLGRDQFKRVGEELPCAPARAPAVTSGVLVDGVLVVGTFDAGVQRWVDGALWPLPLALTPMQRQVNAMLTRGHQLWLATEGGVVEVDLGSQRVTTHSSRPAHDLAVCDVGLVAATEEGLLKLTAGNVERVDTQGVGTGKYMAVTCVGADVYAGGLEGLYRFSKGTGEHLGVARGFDAGWVTALTVHDGRLVVGTYANGVFELRDGAWSPVRGLEHQWVTPHGLKSLEGALWVGGLGMAASAGGAPLDVPARDTFDFVATPSEIFVLTSQGVMTMPRLTTASVP